MKKLLEFIVSRIVDNPKQVKIKESSEHEQEIFSLSVAPEDIGKVIGKNGQIIRAIRLLLRTQAFKAGKRAQLILETPVAAETSRGQG